MNYLNKYIIINNIKKKRVIKKKIKNGKNRY